jgi:hypothetical protein
MKSSSIDTIDMNVRCENLLPLIHIIVKLKNQSKSEIGSHINNSCRLKHMSDVDVMR